MTMKLVRKKSSSQKEVYISQLPFGSVFKYSKFPDRIFIKGPINGNGEFYNCFGFMREGCNPYETSFTLNLLVTPVEAELHVKD